MDFDRSSERTAGDSTNPEHKGTENPKIDTGSILRSSKDVRERLDLWNSFEPNLTK
jgi:hypothetical protein